MSTSSSFLPRVLRRAAVLVLGVALAQPGVAAAAPSPAPEMTEAPAAEPAPAAAEPTPAPSGAEVTLDDAVASGDLASAAAAATAARQADPSPANWHREGEILEALGDYQGAAVAYQGEVDALPSDATDSRRAALGDLQRVRDQARGRVADEPASTHRAELDRQWAPPAKKDGSQRVPKVDPEPRVDPKDRIVRKWYFWVTVVAIVASAAAVTGIAIQASRDERRDALSLTRDQGPQGPALFRF